MCDNECRRLSWAPWLPLSSGRPHKCLLYEFSVTKMKYFFEYAFHVPAAYHLSPCSPAQISGVN